MGYSTVREEEGGEGGEVTEGQKTVERGLSREGEGEGGKAGGGEPERREGREGGGGKGERREGRGVGGVWAGEESGSEGGG